MRRGLTLIEVVVATALLALVVAATLPFFQSASGAFDSPGEDSRDMALLAVFAARLPETPEWKDRGKSTEVSIEWPGDLYERAMASNFRGAPVRVRFPSSTNTNEESESPAPPETATATTFGGDWIEIACGEITINRWISLRMPSSRNRSPRPRRGSRHPTRPHNSATSGRRNQLVSAPPRRSGPSPRAFTLVETIIALALVSALSLTAVSWSVTAARLARASSDRANLDEATRGVLRLINDDIHTFDRLLDVAARGADSRARGRRNAGSSSQGRSGTPPRVRVEEGMLIIDTRARRSLQVNSTGAFDLPVSGGSTLHRYTLDRERSELSLRIDNSPPRVLIKGATDFALALDDETRTLDVSITLEDGTVFSRSYLAP